MNGYDEFDDDLPLTPDSDQPPFETVMDDLFAGETIRIYQLYRLSDMSADEMAHFSREWASAADDRRITMAKHMVDLAEDNFRLNFHPLFAFMFTDPSPEIRQAALEGLWDSTDTSLIAPIVGMLRTDDVTAVRASAARALAHYILLAEWGQFERQYTEEAVEALLETLDDRETADAVRRAALEAVAASGDPEINRHIQDAYDNGSTDLQLSALFAMGNSADPRWLPIVLEELSSPDADVRAEAARAAGGIGHAQAVADLMELISDEDREVAEAAVLALGQIGGDDAQQFLSRIAEDDDYAELHEAVDEALEEMEWAVGDFDLFSLGADDDFLDVGLDFDEDDDLEA